jgi:3-methyl-2-oxobutanoate hydroxymethyltransferase
MAQAMQAERVEGFRDFIADVRGGRFPGPEHVVPAPEGLMEAFVERADRRGG